MQIDIVSDTVCPWCYVGKRRLEKALKQRPDVAAQIRWRAYQLNPEMPPEGMDRRTYMAAKFGSNEKARELFAAIDAAGEGEGIDFQFEQIERSPNTLDSHRLIRWAESAGCQDAVVEDLFKAYFIEGKDISRHTVLTDIAEYNGMDGPLVARLLDEGRDRDLVRQEVDAARSMGITGVPCFIFDGRLAVAGAQDPEVLAQAMDKAMEAAAPASA